MSDLSPTTVPAPSPLRTFLVALAVGCIPAIGVFLAYYIASNHQRDTEPQVRALLAMQQDAWNAGELETFMSGYRDSEDLTFFSGNTVNKGYAAVLARYRKTYQSEGKQMGKLTFSDLDITPMGSNSAFACGRWKVVLPNETLDGLFTLSVQHFPDGWKITHDHTSRGEAKKK